MVRTRGVFKKTGDIKGTFHARMGTIKDRNSKDLTEPEEIKKGWQEYTEEPHTKKNLNDPDNHDVCGHSRRAWLKSSSEVKWALGSISTNTTSGGDGIPVELFQILRDDAVKSAALHMSANLENSAVATELEKARFHSNPQKWKCQWMFKLPYICAH